MKMHHALNSKSVTTCGLEISSLDDESDATDYKKNVDCPDCLQQLLNKKDSSRIIYKVIEKNEPLTFQEKSKIETNNYFNNIIASKRRQIASIHKEIDKLILERDKAVNSIVDKSELTSNTKLESSQ